MLTVKNTAERLGDGSIIVALVRKATTEEGRCWNCGESGHVDMCIAIRLREYGNGEETAEEYFSCPPCRSEPVECLFETIRRQIEYAYVDRKQHS